MKEKHIMTIAIVIDILVLVVIFGFIFPHKVEGHNPYDGICDYCNKDATHYLVEGSWIDFGYPSNNDEVYAEYCEEHSWVGVINSQPYSTLFAGGVLAWMFCFPILVAVIFCDLGRK